MKFLDCCYLKAGKNFNIRLMVKGWSTLNSASALSDNGNTKLDLKIKSLPFL